MDARFADYWFFPPDSLVHCDVISFRCIGEYLGLCKEKKDGTAVESLTWGAIVSNAGKTNQYVRDGHAVQRPNDARSVREPLCETSKKDSKIEDIKIYDNTAKFVRFYGLPVNSIPNSEGSAPTSRVSNLTPSPNSE